MTLHGIYRRRKKYITFCFKLYLCHLNIQKSKLGKKSDKFSGKLQQIWMPRHSRNLLFPTLYRWAMSLCRVSPFFGHFSVLSWYFPGTFQIIYWVLSSYFPGTFPLHSWTNPNLYIYFPGTLLVYSQYFAGSFPTSSRKCPDIMHICLIFFNIVKHVYIL